jgi:hypothetical protein
MLNDLETKIKQRKPHSDSRSNDSQNHNHEAPANSLQAHILFNISDQDQSLNRTEASHSGRPPFIPFRTKFFELVNRAQIPSMLNQK